MMTTEQNTSIPTRKRGNQNNEKPFMKIRTILNIIFIVGAIIGVFLYFYSSHYVGTIVILVSMAFKFIETILRMIR